MKPNHPLPLLLVLAASLCLAAAPARAAGPLVQLRQANQKLHSLARQNASDARLKQFVNRLLDFQTMAQSSLRSHWAGLTPAQRTEFTKLFQRLIEKNYVKGLRKNATYQVRYKRESVRGKTAKVFTVVKTVRRGRPRATDVVYRMKRRGRLWKVFDLITDDVSLAQNYRKSFHRIITQKGFPVLLQKMRKKLGGA